MSEPADDAKPSRIGRLFSGLRIVSLCTLLSRVLGLVREMAMAALFGNGRVLDAFTTAFAIPNLARSLFGEGALSTAFLPLLVREQAQNGQASANRLASAVFMWVGLGLTAFVVVVELLIAGALWLVPMSCTHRLCLTLTMFMLPYLPLICLTAQIGAVLNAAGRFAWPALLPVLFNLCSLAGIWWVQHQNFAAESQAIWLAGFVLLTGAVQVVAPWRELRRAGFRFDRRWREVKDRLQELLRVMVPIVLGLSITQINTLCDRIIAIGFSRPEVVQTKLEAIHEVVSPDCDRPKEDSRDNENASNEPLGDWRPLEAGTASALNQGQRLYQFPLGLLGVALGTVIFPLLTRHAERGDLQRLRDDLSLGLRLVFVVGLPASAGLWLLADVLAIVIFQHGNCSAADAQQTAQMIAAYGIGVWAFCGLLIVHRAFYAIGDRRTPLKIGLIVMLLNLLLNLSLIFIIGGRGLALSTSLCGILQFSLCVIGLQSRVGRLPWDSLSSSLLRSLVASAMMVGIGWWTLRQFAVALPSPKTLLIPLATTVVVSVAVYAVLALVLRLKEFWMLFGHISERSDSDNFTDFD